MPHKIEPAKTGRAACRTCKEPIAKGDLRLGEEVPNDFAPGGEMTFRWHHLECAAKKRPLALKAALAGYEGKVPGRAAVAKTLEEAGPAAKPSTFPYAERAPTGRSKCMACGAAIEKGTLRVAVERELEGMAAKSAGYLHPGCAVAHTGDAA